MSIHSRISDKVCVRCRQPKPATTEYFHRNRLRVDGLHTDCKICRLTDRAENLSHFHNLERVSYRKNSARQSAYQKRRWREEPEYRSKWLAYNREWHQVNADRKRLSLAKWRAANPGRVKANLKRAYESDTLRYTVSGHIGYCLRRSGSAKAGRRFQELLGYSIEALRSHIARQFVVGMDWSNRGTVWELDHIVPLCAFKITSPDCPEFKAAWALSNLRPLLKPKNRSKGGRREHLL